MTKSTLLLLGITLFPAVSFSQKKPLDHSVYDSWQNIGERLISNNGACVVYTINVQEGDGSLVIQQTANGEKLLELPRGAGASITSDNAFVLFKIKPPFKETREARIKKKKPEEMPKDSLGIYTIATRQLTKIPAVKSFKVPEEGGAWVAWLLEKPEPAKPVIAKDSAATSASRSGTPKRNQDNTEEGTELIIKNLLTDAQTRFPLVNDYLFNKKGSACIIRTSKNNADSLSKAKLLWYQPATHTTDTVMKGFYDARSFAIDDNATRLAFVAQRDSGTKAVQKFYELWYYTPGTDSAQLIAGRFTRGMPANYTISENATLQFSKSGQRLFFGTAPVLPLKDTTLPEFERANVDVWSYKDDVLQTVQLYHLNRDLKRSFTAVWDIAAQQLTQLADSVFRSVQLTNEGDGSVFYTSTDTGKRIASQWQGYSLADVYAVKPDGTKKVIIKNFKGNLYPSSTGKYLLLYNEQKKNYLVYNSITASLKPMATDIKHPLYDEENDVPDDPNNYGIVKWMENDSHVLIYDRYDIWQADPELKEKSVNITNTGRQQKISFRYVNTDDEEKFIKPQQTVLLRIFDEKDKSSGLATLSLTPGASVRILWKEKMALASPMLANGILKAKNADWLLYTKETFAQSPDVYVRSMSDTVQLKLSAVNQQQSQYFWGTAALYKWKAYTGKLTEGIVYKPENFDPKKKYPMIVYFYERNNNTLYSYSAPAPTPSRLNIPFFVSRGYIVFVPDIWYTNGHPGKSAYDYIVSGTRALIKEGFVDSTKIGLQGQSWGGYQTVHLITRTNLYAAAWAGAPVVNMFSAYGGIRWESGLNRQFQYEHTQSRIGATIWDKPELYVENSPLFHFPKVKTPLVIMANDADGAVPWYQGIECFTALRRLNKPVWMLNYNGEAHNLVERRNRKDIQIREQQYFDWLLKGEPPAPWLSQGVPAIMKGRTWGL